MAEDQAEIPCKCYSRDGMLFTWACSIHGAAKVTVCSACLTAACWNGIFYCQRSKTAGTVQKTVAELRALSLESPDYWVST